MERRTFVIGDLQGCFASLQALLRRVAYRRGVDRIWLVGDLVNRGPRSLEVLRWARLEPGLVAVLGNHDLHLLALAAGAPVSRPSDTLNAVLAASDRASLIDWLRRRPLLHREGRWLLVHAGIPPVWDLVQAESLAREAEGTLSGGDWMCSVTRWRQPPQPGWARQVRSDWDSDERFAFTLNALTRLRCCDKAGRLDLAYSGPPADAPKGLIPWFERRDDGREATVVFGHWAAMGLLIRPGYRGLDSGCVWGNALTALCLEDDEIFQQPALER